MMLTAQGWSQGSGTTIDWSECRAMDFDPGRAMLAVKLEIMKSGPSTSRTTSTAMG